MRMLTQLSSARAAPSSCSSGKHAAPNHPKLPVMSQRLLTRTLVSMRYAETQRVTAHEIVHFINRQNSIHDPPTSDPNPLILKCTP